MSFTHSPSAIPRPPPTSFAPAGVFRDDYSENNNRRQPYSDHVPHHDTVSDDDDDMDEELIIDTTEHVSRIRTATSMSQRSLNQQQQQANHNNISSSNLSVGSGTVDPPGSIGGDDGAYGGNIELSSSYEYDDTSEADPVFASTKTNTGRKSRKGSRSMRMGGASGGDFVTNDGVMSPEKNSKGSSCCYRWLCCCCYHSYGKYCCGILFVVVLAIVVTTAGVVVAQRGKNSSASSSASGVSPTASANGPDPCPTELSTMENCFGNADKEGACEACVVQYWPAKVENCNDIDDETCAAYRDCPCAPCVNEVDSYVHCLSGCTIECANVAGGTLAPTVTPAPTPPMMCPDQYQAFDNCVDPVNGGSECENCVASNWPPPPTKLSCQEIADYTCPVLAQQGNCGCNNCNNELLNVLLCLSNCTSLSCGTGGTGTGTRALLGLSDGSGAGAAVSPFTYHGARGGDLHSFAEYFVP